MTEQRESVGPIRQGVRWLRDLFLPSSGLMIGENRFFMQADANGNIDPYVGRPDGSEMNLTGEVKLCSCTSDLTLTTSAASITGDGDSSKVRLLLPTIGEWYVTAFIDFEVSATDPDECVGELFVDDSGSAETDQIIFGEGQVNRGTVGQQWKITTTAANTPIELKAKKVTNAGTAKVKGHTTLAATIGAGGGSTVETVDHGTLTGRGDDDHTQYGQLADAETVPGIWDFTSGIKADVIAESTAAAGVTIDGLLLKDGNCDGVDVSGLAGAAFVTLGASGDLSAEKSILETDESTLADTDIHWKWYSGNTRTYTIAQTGAGDIKLVVNAAGNTAYINTDQASWKTTAAAWQARNVGDTDFVGVTCNVLTSSGGVVAPTVTAPSSTLTLSSVTGNLILESPVTGLVNIENLVFADGSITCAGGAIDFADENLSTTGTLAAGATTVTSLTDGTATLTGGALNGVSSVDATTEATIEAAIDTLANLTSVQGLTVTLADAGADALFGWDDTASAYENLTQAEVLAVIGTSSPTAQGVVELAIASEVDTGTSTSLAVSPDSLAGSNLGERIFGILVSDPGGDALTTGDTKAMMRIPSSMTGMELVEANACVTTVSSSGPVTIQVAKSSRASATTRAASVDMLSTPITIDVSEFDSLDAATEVVKNDGSEDVVTGDQIRIDVDAAGTGVKGLFVELIFRLP